MRHFTQFIMTVATALLTGCAASFTGLDAESNFACRAPKGIPCQSISATNFNINRGMESGTDSEAKNTRPGGPPRIAPISVKSLPTPSTGTPLRRPERILRVWMAPFEDTEGALHDQRYIYFTVEGGGWQMQATRLNLMDSFQTVMPLSSQSRIEEAVAGEKPRGAALPKDYEVRGPQPESPDIYGTGAE